MRAAYSLVVRCLRESWVRTPAVPGFERKLDVGGFQAVAAAAIESTVLLFLLC